MLPISIVNEILPLVTRAIDTGDLEMIEVQSGGYVGEDDIVRVEDQYGRDEK